MAAWRACPNCRARDDPLDERPDGIVDAGDDGIVQLRVPGQVSVEQLLALPGVAFSVSGRQLDRAQLGGDVGRTERRR